MKYINQPIEKYLNDLAARLPAPGGGSAAALVASTGVSLLCMVANFTIDKKGYEQYQEEIKEILKKLEASNKRLQDLIDLDIAVYEKVSAAYKLPKNTEQEKLERDNKIQEVLKEAMSVPWEIMEIAVDSVPFAEKLSKIGNKNLISDITCAMEFLNSAINSAIHNIEINLKSITDRAFVKGKKTEFISKNNSIKPKIEKIIKDTSGFIAF